MALHGIEAMIGALNCGADLSSRVTLVIVGYFDDSGTHGGAAAVTMAGYVSHMDDWGRFERRSEKLFKRVGITSVFHAKEFFHGEGEFAGWSHAKKIDFSRRWFHIAETRVLRGTTISVHKKAFDAARKEHRMIPNTSAYAYCLNIILKRLCQRNDVWAEIEKHDLSMILEAGVQKRDRGVEIEFHDIAERHNLEKHFSSLTTAPKSSSRGLQLGDYLAYFSWRQAERAVRGTLKERSEFLDIAMAGVETDIALAEGFTPNPSWRKRSVSRGRSS